MAPYTSQDHSLAIEALSTQVRAFYTSRTPFRINHGSTNSTRVRDPSTPTLNIAHLNHILSIDTTTKTALVEPNVPLDGLLTQTTKYNLMPPVVMEFPGITVGGGFAGASGESSSWREGLFDCGVLEIEVILGNGEVVEAQKGGANAELFDGSRCSMGTLGVVTLLKVKLVDAKPFVEVKYHCVRSVKEMIEETVRFCEEGKDEDLGLDFVEAIQYSESLGVVITGRMTSSSALSAPNEKIQRFDRAFDPWFYQHALNSVTSSSSSPSPTTKALVPLQSYLFRYDRGAFWTGESLFTYFGLPNNIVTRTILNPALTTRAIYRSMHAGGGPETNIVQDLVLPTETAENFIQYVSEELKIWPIWVCPVRRKVGEGDIWGWPVWHDIDPQSSHSSNLRQRKSNPKKDIMTLNLGVWGPGSDDAASFLAMNRRMEEKLRALHGMKVLYAHAWYTEDEFWDLYDKEKYERMRKAWHAEGLPTVWQKIKRPDIKQVGKTETGWQKKMWGFLLGIWPLGGIIVGVKSVFG